MVLLIVLLEKSELEEFYKLNIQGKYFKNFVSTPITDILWSLMVIMALFYTRKEHKVRKIVTKEAWFLSFAVASLYLYYRLRTDFFDNFKTWFIPAVRYTDIAVYPFVHYIILASKRSISNGKIIPKTRIISDEALSADNEAEALEKDLYGRWDLAQAVSNRILNSFIHQSLAIAIVGKWGSGKTTFLNFIKAGLEKEDLVVINFNPWKCANSSSIINTFFAELINELAKYSSRLPSVVKKYVVALTESEKGYLKTLNDLSFFGKNDKGIEAQFVEINTLLKKINKKVLVFIDDIDRLDANEILEVIRLIRNTASFHQTIFVVAYDRSYILSALKSTNLQKPETYLEKIFQLELSLPLIEGKPLNNSLYQQLIENLPSEYKEEINNLVFRKDNNNLYFLQNMIQTKRDLIRLLNSFFLRFEQLKGEVYLRDLFYLEMFKLKFPVIYGKFIDKIGYFTSSKEVARGEYICVLEKGKAASSENDELNLKGLESSAFKDYLISKKRDFELDNDDIILILKLLDVLFNSQLIYSVNESWPKRLSVRFPDRTDLYLYDKLLDSSLSEVEFVKAYSGDWANFKTCLNKWVDQGKARYVALKLTRKREYKNQEDFEKALSAIIHVGELPPKDEYTNYNWLDAKSIVHLFNDHTGKISAKFYKNNPEGFSRFVRSLFKESRDRTFFRAELISVTRGYINSKIEAFKFPLTIDELNDFRIIYLKEYLQPRREIRDLNWDFIDITTKNSIETIELGGQKEVEVYKLLPEPRSILEAFVVENGLITFLESCVVNINRRSNARTYNISVKLYEIFGSFDNCKSILQARKEDERIIEFLDFFLKLETNNFEAISYTFKHLHVNINAWNDPVE